jgi:hypothetical protein
MEHTMHHDMDKPAMNQKIFSIDLKVETVSLYLLCCALADAGATVTTAALMDKWNDSRKALERELERLERRNIICSDNSGKGRVSVYRMTDEKRWR